MSKFDAIFLGYVDGKIDDGFAPLQFVGEIGGEGVVTATPTTNFTPYKLVMMSEDVCAAFEIEQISVNGEKLLIQECDPIPCIVFSRISEGVRFASPECPAGQPIAIKVREARP